MKIFIALLSVFTTWLSARGQECAYFPADCPQTGNIEAARDSDVSIGNLVVPQEITMQDDLRKLLTSAMEEIAAGKKWELYEYTEETGGGVDSDGQPTPFALRPPHQFTISFVFIVNKDSLHAWQSWYYNDLKNESDKVADSYRSASNASQQENGTQKQIDSVTYYSNLKARYMTDHAADYQKAILGGDTKSQKKYEEEMKKYDEKINRLIRNTNQSSEQSLAGPNKQFNDLKTYKRNNTLAFRNGSMIRVSFGINEAVIIADDAEKKVVKSLSFPGVGVGVLMHNEAPDEHESFGQYYRSPYVALLLLGKWALKQDEYRAYHAVYSADKKNTDAATVKKIPCDKLQTMSIHVEGSPRYIEELLKSLDTEKLHRLLVQ